MRHDMELVHERRRHDDAGDVVDDEVEDVAVDARYALLDDEEASNWPVDAVNDDRGHQPQDGAAGIVVQHSSECEHRDYDAECGEDMHSPRLPALRAGCGQLIRSKHAVTLARS